MSRIKESGKLFQKAIHLHSKAPPHLYQKVANLYLAARDTSSALDWLKKGIEKTGTIMLLTNLQIEIYLKKGEMQQALAVLDRQFQNKKNKVRYYYRRGEIFRQLNLKEKSKAAFEKSIAGFTSIPKRVSESKPYRALKDSIHQYLKGL